MINGCLSIVTCFVFELSASCVPPIPLLYSGVVSTPSPSTSILALEATVTVQMLYHRRLAGVCGNIIQVGLFVPPDPSKKKIAIEKKPGGVK